MVTELKPQLALVDLGLPGLDGLERARRIRASPGGDAVVLVALTGYRQRPDRADLLGKVIALAAQRSASIV